MGLNEAHSLAYIRIYVVLGALNANDIDLMRLTFKPSNLEGPLWRALDGGRIEEIRKVDENRGMTLRFFVGERVDVSITKCQFYLLSQHFPCVFFFLLSSVLRFTWEYGFFSLSLSMKQVPRQLCGGKVSSRFHTLALVLPLGSCVKVLLGGANVYSLDLETAHSWSLGETVQSLARISHI